MRRTISFTLNGKPARVTADDERMLLGAPRYDLGLAGAKFGRGAALCGACAVIVNKGGGQVPVAPVSEPGSVPAWKSSRTVLRKHWPPGGQA